MDEQLNKTTFPDVHETRREDDGWNGDGCMFFWGKFDDVCEVIGKIVVGVVTLGIAPLVVYLCRKNKKEAK